MEPVERYLVRATLFGIGLYGLIFISRNYRVNKNMEYILR